MALPLLVLLIIVIGATFGCRPRDYGNGGTVCVCNKSYCDTYDEVVPLTNGKYEMYTSSLAGDRFMKTSGLFERCASNTNATLTIKPEIKLQEIFGFGGSFTDAAGINILSLSNAARLKLMEAYFAPNGIEYTMGRVPIGGSDFSPRAYTYDDVEGDVNLNNFSLQFEDYNYKIPFIKLANKLSKYELKLIGSAWSAPAWMKTNNRLAGIGSLNLSMYDAWGEYHIKFLDAYRAQGIDYWGVTTGNEPVNALSPSTKINDMGWDPAALVQWIVQSLGPKIRLNTCYTNLKIMIIDDERSVFPWLPRLIYQNMIARSYIDGAAVHYYYDRYVPADVLSVTHFDFPEKFILSTEGSEEIDSVVRVVLGSWSRAERYLTSIIDDLNNWVTGWVDWNLAVNVQGGPTYTNNLIDSPIIVNKTSDEFYKQPTYFAMGHFSKFIPPGSVRVATSCAAGSDVKSVVVQRPDGGIVAQVFNPTDSDKMITLREHNSREYMKVLIKKRSMNSILYWK